MHARLYARSRFPERGICTRKKTKKQTLETPIASLTRSPLCFASAGATGGVTVGIHAAEGDKNPTAVVVTVGDVSTTVKGIFQAQAKQVVALCAGRKDLTVSAMGAGVRWAILTMPLGVCDAPSGVG
jgi:hypothetical protein